MADNDTTFVRIESGNHGGNTRVGVNGAFIQIPHETDFPVHVAYVSALRDSNVDFKIVSGAVPRSLSPDAGGEGALPSASGSATTVGLDDQVNSTAALESAATVENQGMNAAGPIDGAAAPTAAPPEMAQGSQGHDGMTAEQKANEPTTTPEPALDNQDTPSAKSEGEKAEDKETLASNADDTAREAADEGDGELDGKPFNSTEVLAGSIKTISENLDEFTPRQIKALIAAEEKREGGPRSTLIEALNKKLG